MVLVGVFRSEDRRWRLEVHSDHTYRLSRDGYLVAKAGSLDAVMETLRRLDGPDLGQLIED